MGLSRNGSWRSAVGLGLLVPVLAVSSSFPFEPGASGSIAGLQDPSAGSTFPVQEAVPRSTVGVALRDGRAAPLIALQAGHWRAVEAPAELRDVRYGGTIGGGKAEWEVTLEIADRAAQLLEQQGYVVDVLPATVPPGYQADLFISIHADGYNDPAVSGYTIAAPRRDQTRRASEFVEVLAEAYGEATRLRRRPNATRRMQNYYAFNSRRYRHAIHPMTVGVIIETGFLTSPTDRRVIVENPELSARGIADAVVRFVPVSESTPLPVEVTAGVAR